MEDRVDLGRVELREQAAGLLRRYRLEAYAASVRLSVYIRGDREGAIGAGAHDKTPTTPRNALIACERRVPELTAPRLGRALPPSAANGKQALVGAVFAKLDVLGFQRLEYELTPDAVDLGLNAALPPVIELESKIGEFGRGERDSPYETQQSVRFLLINQTPPRDAAEQSA